MVFGVVTSDGDIMYLFIIQHKLRSSGFSSTWIRWVATERPYICQQDSALGFTSKKTLG